MRAALLLLLCTAIPLICAVQTEEPVPSLSGVVNFAEGKVLLNSQEVTVKGNSFPRVQVNQTIQTGERPVEVLLVPGSVLRLGGNSAVRMISDRFEDTRVELVKGSAVVECVESPGANAVILEHNQVMISLLEGGLYRLDAEPAQLSVYEGQARVAIGGKFLMVTKEQRLLLDGFSVVERFDRRTADPLVRWAQQRSKKLARANGATARTLQYVSESAWIFDARCGCYTFVPGRWSFRSFWGQTYWSPYAAAPQGNDPWTAHRVFDGNNNQTQQAPPPQ